MLEMMIALVLVGACALPLAQIPMRALQQECKSAYRMQAQRLADLAFADLKEKLYRKEIPWKEIASPSNNKSLVLEDVVEVAIDPLGKRKFNRRGTLHSVGKKNAKEEEFRLVTFRVKIQPVEKNIKLFRAKKNLKDSCSFSYQFLVNKTSNQAPSLTPPEGPPKTIAPEGPSKMISKDTG
jgi:hypothetical protein